jgi:ferredoxin
MSAGMSAGKTAGTRLAVDLIACDGRGLCAELLPELITLDDWGYPMLSRGEVPAALRDAARAAVKMCPKLALRLETRDPASGAGRQDRSAS